MAILVFILIVALVLSAIAAPVVYALRRRAWRTALVAGAIGFGAQALFVTYLEDLGPEQGAFAMLIGIPGVALATCALSMLVIARITSRTRP